MQSTIQETYWRLSVLTAAIALLSAFVLVIGLNWYNARADLQEDLTMQARVVSATTNAALLFNDTAAANETLAAFSHAPVVVAAVLYRNDGKALASFRRGVPPHKAEAAPAPLEPESTQGLIRIEAPVLLEERSLGTLVLWGSLTPLYTHQLRFLIGFAVIAGLAGIIAYLAGRGIRHRLADNQVELEQSRTLLRQLTAYREKVVEEEHKRIAREIHDELGQVLTTALLHLKRLDRLAAGGNAIASGQIKEIGSLVEDAIRGVKGIASELRPAVLNIGFAAAIEWLVERALANSGIACQIDIPDSLPHLDDSSAITLFRIVQESLTNVIRHAKATSVRISLRLENSWLRLEVVDDGIGLHATPAKGQPHFGLVGMQERATALGGLAEITGSPGRGTRVRVSLPYVRDASGN